jgi:hypothetical protein
MLENRDPAAKYFACSESERACFEAGIKLGAIYHQYVGTPVSLDSVDALEEAIQAGVRIQPFVSDVHVRIDRSELHHTKSTYKYTSLKGEMMDVWLQVRYGGSLATCEMKYVKDLKYTLMRIASVQQV